MIIRDQAADEDIVAMLRDTARRIHSALPQATQVLLNAAADEIEILRDIDRRQLAVVEYQMKQIAELRNERRQD
jgi:hypothetical protein